MSFNFWQDAIGIVMQFYIWKYLPRVQHRAGGTGHCRGGLTIMSLPLCPSAPFAFCPENECRTVLLVLYHPAWSLSLWRDLSTTPRTFSVTNVEMVIDQINDRDIQIMRRTPTVDGHYKLWKIKYWTERKSREEEKR